MRFQILYKIINCIAYYSPFSEFLPSFHDDLTPKLYSTHMRRMLINKEAKEFYSSALAQLTAIKLPFMLGGAFALMEYTGIIRDTKDLDIFTPASDYPKILEKLKNEGYKTEITDARWLAKAWKDEHYIDIIFSQVNGISPVDTTWFDHAPTITFLGSKTQVLPPEELIWTKAYVMDRWRFDGADINHIILKKGKTLDWNRLLTRMEPHWELLLSHIINFRFVYPSEGNNVPTWVMNELLEREKRQLTLPSPIDKICRGTLISRYQYDIDINIWGFKDIK